MTTVVSICPGLGWDRVYFLHSSSYDVIFCSCDRNGVDNIPVFKLLLNNTYAASRPFLLLMLPCQQRRLGLHKKLGGHTARTADPNLPKSYSIPSHVMLSNKICGKEGGRGGCSE